MRARLVLVCALLVAGCEQVMQNMYDQPRHKPFAVSRLFADGTSAREPPPGTVPYARGTLAGTSSAWVGTARVDDDLEALAAARLPYPITRALLARGRERFTIYCQPCHGALGDGDGLVARRGFPHPPSYHSDKLRAAPDRHFFDVITHGHGIMYSYADRVAPVDRWAIVAYIRALQLSQGARPSGLPAEVREELAAASGGAR